jgi:hypothetical protein
MDSHARRPRSVRTSRSLVLASLAVALACSLAGCAPAVYYTPLVAPPHPLAPRPVEKVDVYLVTPPARPHVDVGIVQVVLWGEVDGQNVVDTLLGLIKEKAAEVGCDAVLVTSIDRQGRPAPHSAAPDGPSIQGSCVAYKESPPHA